MAIALTTPFPVPNGTRLVVSAVRPFEDADEMRVTVTLRSPGPTNHKYAELILTIRNGLCDRVNRGTMGPDQGTDSLLLYEPSVLSIASGFTNAMNAWKAGNSASARKLALETHLLSVGVIHSSLAGAVS